MTEFRERVVALWQARGLTRAWNDPHTCEPRQAYRESSQPYHT